MSEFTEIKLIPKTLDINGHEVVVYEYLNLPEVHRLLEIELRNKACVQAVMIHDDGGHFFVPISSSNSNIEGFQYDGWLEPTYPIPEQVVVAGGKPSQHEVMAWRYI